VSGLIARLKLSRRCQGDILELAVGLLISLLHFFVAKNHHHHLDFLNPSPWHEQLFEYHTLLKLLPKPLTLVLKTIKYHT
jgi:hypothetical protein